MKRIIMVILFGIVVFFPLVCSAAYVIHLKDGRSFTTSECREEGDQIKFKRFGGVIGIPKDQVKEIEEIEDLPEEKAEAAVPEAAAKAKSAEQVKGEQKPEEVSEKKKDESKNGIDKEVILKEKRRILAKKGLIMSAYQQAKKAGDKEEKDKQRENLLLLEKELAKIREEVRAANQGRLPPWWNNVK